MKNKIIFFSIDRLGDFLIRSNVINKISKNYKFKEIVCSEKNYKLIKTQKYFNKVNLFNTNYKIINKFIYLFSFFLSKYDSVIVFDGKGISNLVLLIIKAKFKFTFIYKKKGNRRPKFNITDNSVKDDQSFRPLYICAERQVPMPQKKYMGSKINIIVFKDILTSYSDSK